MTPAELQEALHAVQPGAVLVAPAVLHRIIRQTHKLPRWQWSVPHEHSVIVERQFLFRFLEQEDLLFKPDQVLPPIVLVLEIPENAALQEVNRAPTLLTYWRRLFHASIDRAMSDVIFSSQDSSLQERIDSLGQATFDEIQEVLKEENCLAPNADPANVYREFVALFFELYHFAPHLLPSFFPGLRDVEETRLLLSRDVNAAELFERTRLPGAPDPGRDVPSSYQEVHEYFYELLKESAEAMRSENMVLAAILKRRAARVAPAAQAYDARQEAVQILERLVGRLQKALDISPAELPKWSQHLAELLDKADQGAWPPEAAILYDLQKVCLDFEQEIYTLDLVEWALSGGKKRVKRPLTSQRFVRMTRHLRAGANRLTSARMSDADRKECAELLQAALHRCEKRVRERFRPILISAMEDVGLKPHNPPERTAFLKMVEELLDRILAYGFLTFSDLRDVISRNQLKLPDLADPQDFIKGDPLLRLDRRLATLLDGVYRRGEVYLRWLERFTALNFGTALGRWLTRFVTLPFLSAFLVMEAVRHFVLHPMGVEEVPWFVYAPVLLLAGGFLFSLIHSRTVRQKAENVGRAFWRPVRRVIVEGPYWLVHNTSFQEVAGTWTFQLFYWYVFKPLCLCALLWLLVPDSYNTWLEIALAILAANFVVNSRPGQAASEALKHGLRQLIVMLRAGLIPSLIRAIVHVFKKINHAVERVLFGVDEWLRFRGDDTTLGMALRVLMGVVWFPISYLTRFIMVVLIEPCLNPVKLPICSIAAKIVYPLFIPLDPWMRANLSPAVYGLALVFIFFLPDAFGFLFWEMKENWSLYRANRGRTLKPVVVGSHGETLPQLLKPGFHSGTVPKLFRKLRHAEEQAEQTGNYSPVRACQVSLNEVEEAVRLFVDRELIVLLNQERVWEGHPLSVGRVHLTTNTIHVELMHRDFPGESAWLEFEEHGGKIKGSLRPAPWLAQLPVHQLRSFHNAVAILYKLAGVDVLAEPDPTLSITHVPLPASWEHVIDSCGPKPVLETNGMLAAEVPPAVKNGNGHRSLLAKDGEAAGP